MQWWVVNHVTRPGGPRGPQQTNYVVIQSATRPVNAVAGPYANQQDADNWRNRSNAYGNSPKSAAAQSAKDLFHGFEWGNILLRVGEVMLGIVLIGVGIARLTGADNYISKALGVAAKGAIAAA